MVRRMLLTSSTVGGIPEKLDLVGTTDEAIAGAEGGLSMCGIVWKGWDAECAMPDA